MTGTPEKLVLWLMGQEKTKLFDVKEHREKRSLTQNAYYWVLNNQLAKKLHISTSRLHNLMLRECAPPFMIDDHIAMQPIPDTEAAEAQVLESETYHLRPSSGTITGKDGVTYRWYILLRGSSTFNTAEMSALLDRLIEDCKEQGIETLPPQEIMRMRQEEYARENEKNSYPDESEAEGMGT